MKTFWMVHRVNGNMTPTKIHETKESAEKEANRLAALYTGHVFAVLETVSAWQVTLPPPQKIPLL